LQALNRAKVKYLVVGGVAAIYHGIPRGTFDLDLAVELIEENLQRLEAVIKHLGFLPKIPASVTGLGDPRTRRTWTVQRNMKVFSFEERRPPFRMIDVMVKPLRNFTSVYGKRIEVQDCGVTIPLAPISTLIDMKTGTGRVQDQEDIRYLRFIQSVQPGKQAQ
jgi:hypothetical protein